MTFTAHRRLVNELALPAGVLEEYARLCERVDAKNAGYLTVRLEAPRRPRTTGERSQNSRHWGHCDDIAEQLTTSQQRYTKEDVDAALRRMSVREGLPTFIGVDGAEEPIHHSEMSVEQADVVERVKQRFADEHDLWLTEYDDSVSPPVAYRSVGGRTRKEMEERE